MQTLALVLLVLISIAARCGAGRLPSREQQLKDLQGKQILVFMWGWSADEIAPAAKKLGFQVVNAPSGNDIKGKAPEVATWQRYGLKMLARPAVPVKDPFDPDDARRGCDELARVIAYYDANPDVIGFGPYWGLYGEGGFPFDYKFSDKARDAFNAYVGTPGQPFPDKPADGQPGSLRWTRWMEFRSKTLRDFRRTFIEAAKKVTNKLVGTWSEFYPTENYQLNMGEAPGADFLLYDLSFGDVTTDQTRAFAECHGDMQHYAKFEEWRDHELPLMAKAAGEGVVPIAFQFPMRRGHAVDFLSKTTVFTDRVEDEYSLRSGPDIRKLIDASRGKARKPEVALVYQSFEAGALPGGQAFQFYQPSARFIGGMLFQMGVDVRVIPYEFLETEDLAEYKLVIVPDPMYLPDAMRRNLRKARKVLYSGEYLLTHHDPASAAGDFNTGWSGVTDWEGGKLRYGLFPAGKLSAIGRDRLTRGVADHTEYPADQAATFDPLPRDAKVLLKVGETPVLITREDGRVIHVANRFFNHAYHAKDDSLEKIAFALLKNVVTASGARIRVSTGQLARVKESSVYGSYGVTGPIAWNATQRDLTITLASGRTITIPRCGWTPAP